MSITVAVTALRSWLEVARVLLAGMGVALLTLAGTGWSVDTVGIAFGGAVLTAFQKIGR